MFALNRSHERLTEQKCCSLVCFEQVDLDGLVSLPLIPASETGPIQPVSGMDVDELLSDDPFAA